jgi:hypothetical protein
MKYLFTCLLASLLIITPSYAQENADDVLVETQQDASQEEVVAQTPKEETYDRRLELSKEMHEIWPTRPKIEAAIDAVGEQIPQADRTKFKAAMRRVVKYNALEEKSIETMAEIFTVAELEAMLAFYGSKEGRSVSFKTGDYEAALQPLLVKMIDKALLDTRLGTQ